MNKNEFDDLFATKTYAEQIENDSILIGFRFLSIIDRMMEEKAITKKALAEMIGASPSYITQLFRGHVRVNLEFIAKVEKAYGLKFNVALSAQEYRMENYPWKDSCKMISESSAKTYIWNENLENAQNEPIAA